jgi:hypothetical protein
MSMDRGNLSVASQYAALTALQIKPETLRVTGQPWGVIANMFRSTPDTEYGFRVYHDPPQDSFALAHRDLPATQLLMGVMASPAISPLFDEIWNLMNNLAASIVETIHVLWQQTDYGAYEAFFLHLDLVRKIRSSVLELSTLVASQLSELNDQQLDLTSTMRDLMYHVAHLLDPKILLRVLLLDLAKFEEIQLEISRPKPDRSLAPARLSEMIGTMSMLVYLIHDTPMVDTNKAAEHLKILLIFQLTCDQRTDWGFDYHLHYIQPNWLPNGQHRDLSIWITSNLTCLQEQFGQQWLNVYVEGFLDHIHTHLPTWTWETIDTDVTKGLAIPSFPNLVPTGLAAWTHVTASWTVQDIQQRLDTFRSAQTHIADAVVDTGPVQPGPPYTATFESQSQMGLSELNPTPVQQEPPTGSNPDTRCATNVSSHVSELGRSAYPSASERMGLSTRHDADGESNNLSNQWKNTIFCDAKTEAQFADFQIPKIKNTQDIRPHRFRWY